MMLSIRQSPDSDPNAGFAKDESNPFQSNTEWIQRWREVDSTFCSPGDVVLLGGQSLADFRVRVAQSPTRHDLTPSYWSLVGVVDAGGRILTAPLWPLQTPDRVPVTNGIRSLELAEFADENLWPNMGIIRFPGARQDPVECVKRLTRQRSIVDIPTLLVTWLGFAWGGAAAGNPLVGGVGLPSAVLVETAFGLAEVELTPGLATASSCPEAIYQAAKWWTDYYVKTAGPRRRTRGAAAVHPEGRYIIRKPEATYVDPLPDPLLEPKSDE